MLHAYHKCCTNGNCNVFLWQIFTNQLYEKEGETCFVKKINYDCYCSYVEELRNLMVVAYFRMGKCKGDACSHQREDVL